MYELFEHTADLGLRIQATTLEELLVEAARGLLAMLVANPGEVRPGNAAGDAPSAAAGDLVTRQERRVLGLPVTTALVLAGVVVTLLVVAGIVIPGARRRDRARGGGTYGRP